MNNFLKRIFSFMIRTDKRGLIMRSLLLLTILASINVLGYASMQPKMVTGQITDQKTGESLPGVNVIIVGTTTGVITDLVGRYSLQVPNEDAVLLVSYIGYVSQNLPVRGLTVINVQLSQEIKSIDEVVVIGYGTQKKQSVVGSIAVVTEKELLRRGGVYNLAQAISGQLGGVTVMEKTGEPGREDPSILIRGASTWNGTQPLILVDGIERRMSDVDVNEVATISVLKDASATAVFGVKGANGVILITTKRGQVGKPKLSLSANTGFKSHSKINTVMEAFSAQSWKNAAIEREVSVFELSWGYYVPYEQLLRSKKPQVAPYDYLYPNISWKDELFKDYGRNSRYNLNLQGGTEFVKYFASIGYLTEGDILKTSPNTVKGYEPRYSYDRFNFRANLDLNLTKTTLLTTDLSGYLGKRVSPGGTFAGDGTAHIFSGYFSIPPDAFPVKYPSGRYGFEPTNLQLYNPVAILNESGVILGNRRNVSTEAKLVQKLDFITKGLRVAGSVSYDTYVTSSGPSIIDGSNQGQALYERVTPAILDAKTLQDTLNATFYYGSLGATGINDFDFFLRPWSIGTEGVGSFSRSLVYQLSTNYERTFGKHDITGLALFKREQRASGSSFPSYREDWVGRITYGYNSTYFLDFNAAYNGTEKFSKDYRFGFFPSMAIGWMISEESFMDKYEWLTKLKVRASIGLVGSDDFSSSRWPYVDSWTYGGGHRTYDNNGTLVTSPYTFYREGTIANDQIRWETATKRNLGAEIAILDGVFTLDLDFFKDNRKDIFLSASQRNIPNFFGAAPVAANLGATETTGYEIQLGINKRWTNGFGLWFKEGINRATDVITAYEDPILLPDYQKRVGFQIGQNKTQIRTGFMNNWDDVYASSPADVNRTYRLPGDWNINDFNGDGIINTFDSAPFGYPSRPQNSYSTELGLMFKGLSFMVQFYGVTNIMLSPYYVTPELARWTAVSETIADYWTPDNMDAAYKQPRLGTSTATGDYTSQDASYLRLKTLEISYSIPSNFIKFIGLANARVYLNGNNLYYWSKFPADLETSGFASNNAYPLYKTINLGIDITF